MSWQVAVLAAHPSDRRDEVWVATTLVVDDEHALRTLYAQVLRDAGFRVITAASLSEGLRQLGEHDIDLVVTDRRLPDGDGLDIIREARARCSPIPSILVTGLGAYSARDAAAAVGADRSFAKPFSLIALVTAVRELVAMPGVTVSSDERPDQAAPEEHHMVDELAPSSP